MAALGVARKQQKQILRANLPFLLAIEKYSLSGSYSLAIGFVKEYAFASVGGTSFACASYLFRGV
eukprot:scaffold16_cov147-Skeletonema_menzelii.AAC.10